MDPVTGVGLGLAILPLIISAIENYEHTFQPIIIFTRDSRKVAKQFQDLLHVQQTTFENEIRLLLKEVTRRQDDMMADLQDYDWRHAGLERKLQDVLGDSYSACAIALTLVNDTLQEIIDRYGGTSILLNKRSESKVSFLNRWRQRSKVSFRKQDIDTRIDQLRTGNEDLKRLRNQIHDLQKERETSTVNIQGARIRAKPQDQAVNYASQRLHEVLKEFWPCHDHQSHSAMLSLETRVESIPLTTSQAHASQTQAAVIYKVSFELAWACLNVAPSPNSVSTRPLWLTVETIRQVSSGPFVNPSSSGAGQMSLQQLSRVLEQASISRHGASSNTSIQQTSLASTSVAIATAPDLRRVRNLCLLLKDQQPLYTSSKPECVGYLSEPPATSTAKHLIFASKDQSRSNGHQPPTLNDALLFASATPYGWGPADKLYVARSLALSVLHFHSTPWLPERLSSADILFPGVLDFARDSLGAPHVRSSFQHTTRQQGQIAASSTPTASQEPSIHYSDFAHNRLLHSLGVILIELAFDRPLSALLLPEDIRKAGSDAMAATYAPFFAAKRLESMVSRRVNAKYARVVARCLRCDFGLALDDLQDTRLQGQVAELVVAELESCLRAASIC